MTIVSLGMVCILMDAPRTTDCNNVADWALPDQLVAATVSALLRIASRHAEYREAAMGAITTFVSQIVSMLCKGDCT